MKYAALVLLLAAPLAAQKFEVGAFVGQQSYKDVNVLIKEEVATTTPMAVRFGYSFVDFGPVLFQGTVTHQMETKGEFKEAGFGTGVDYKHSHTALGAMFNFKAMFAVGAGVEYRMERLSLQGLNSVTYNRPWVRAHLGYAFPTPILKPFIGLDVAVPVSSTSANLNSNDEEFLKSLAPKFQVGLYGGIRF